LQQIRLIGADRVRVDNVDMRLAEGALIHQVHPAKIGADAAAAMVSAILLWRHRPKAAVAVRCVVPAVGSVAVLGLADLDGLARTRRGRYVLAHMPPSAQAVRLAGDALMGVGAYRRSARLILAGAFVVAAGWSHGLWRHVPRRQDARVSATAAMKSGPSSSPRPGT
jgi:hypothetical protein